MTSRLHPATQRLVRAEDLKRRPAPSAERGAPPVDARALERDLRRSVEGEVRFDAGSRAMYALDASNYRHVPVGVVVPRTREDVVAAVAVCRAHGVPIVSRAGGTGLAGQTTGPGVVIDFSKYLHHVLALDPIENYAVVEPGVVCDQLDEAAERFDLAFGPRPATHNRCGFGGMLGNNSCGSYAQMAGKAVDNTEAMDVLLYDGTQMSVGWMTDPELEAAIRRGGPEGDLYAKLKALRARWGDTIRERFPKLPRRVSGYNLDELLPGDDGRFNVARALVGSESTLVTILAAKVRLVWRHPQRVLVALGYPDIYAAADVVTEILPFKPIALEGFDQVLHHNLEIKRGRPTRYMEQLLPKGCGWLFVEFGDATIEQARDRARAMVAHVRKLGTPPVDVATYEGGDRKHLWKVREGALGAESFVPGKPDTWPGWEDSAVSPERLGGYLRELRALFERYDYHPALYGHFGMGCVHCTVAFDLYTAAGVAKYRAFVHEAAELVARYGGSLSGEHGDGQARGELLPIMFGPELVQAFREYKAIWDPAGKMNPGRVVDARPLDADLRLGADYRPWQPETHFKYPEDGGSFAHATLRCIGVGLCRRKGAADDPDRDVMCPSFMVLEEEKHTTRGRAHLLHEMLVQGPVKGGWRDENVKEALDLCLSCKGCKGDCPVNVDVATHKAEFLSHYYDGRIRPRSAYAFGLIDQWARVASLAPGLVNLVTQLPGTSAIAKLAAGMPQARHIPPFAPETFRQWFARRAPRSQASRGRVVLWADTFNNYFHTDVAKAAVEVLEHAGLEVVVPEGHLCCGRPLYDYGFLPTAKRYLERVLTAMAPHLAAGTPIVVLEPSCASVFRDELHGLFPDREDAARMRSQVKLLSELLTSEGLGYSPPRLERKAVSQGHCHHKSIFGYDDETELLCKMGVKLEPLSSGCCGMAGSFGFEAGEKHSVSIAAGERVLLPAVRAAQSTTLVVADGFSCKTQIAQSTKRGGLHVAEVLSMALRDGPAGPRGVAPPERASVERAAAEVRRSMWRSAATIAAVAIAAVAMTAWRRLARRPRFAFARLR